MFVFDAVDLNFVDYIQPLVPLVLGILLVFLLVKQSMIRKKLLKGRLIFTFLIVLGCALVLAFYKEIISSDGTAAVIQWVLFGIDVVIGVLYIIFSEISSSREQFNKELFLTLDESKFYVLVDKKNRIKEMSTLFLEDINATIEEVYKKNLFDVIERKYRIFKLNETDVSIEDLNIYFSSPDTKETSLNLEIHDEHGDVTAYYFHQRPITIFGKLNGRIFVGDKKGTEELVGMEKNLVESSQELDMIKSRFMTLLEKTGEGVFFKDLTNQTIWINDILKQKLFLNHNTMSLNDFYKNVKQEDMAMLQEKMSMVNNINPKYSLSYRYNTGNRYTFIKEEGSRITNGKVVELCGFIRILDGYKYEKTETELDNIAGEPEMLAAINRLYKEGQTFQAVHLHISSLEKTNAEYGRNVGNMVLSEYIKWLKNRYVDANLIYRVSGLEFVAVVTDYRKMEKLKNDLLNNEKILHMNIDYGMVKTKMEVLMGICYSSDASEAKEIIKKTKEALRFCSKERYNANYAYYKDIR